MYYSHYDFFFNILSQQQHINKQIRYSVGTLWKPVYGIFLHTYCIKQNGISNIFVIHFKTVENQSSLNKV